MGNEVDNQLRRTAHREWWQQASLLHAVRIESNRQEPEVDAYQFGDGVLELEADDATFRQRFQHAYGECALLAAQSTRTTHRVRCTVRAAAYPQVIQLVFDDPEPLDLLDYSLRLFPDRRYREISSPLQGWRCLASADAPNQPFMMVCGNQAYLDAHRPWQSLVGSCAVNRVLRLQTDMLFFHAASVGIRDVGMLLTGSKGAGKSTTALTLASRGHHFLGDEFALIRRTSGEMVPFRRAASIRPGPCARALATILSEGGLASEPYPDGVTRMRANVGELFPQASARLVPLRYAIFLRQFAPQPYLEPFCFTRHHLRLLQPLSCTFWGMSPGRQLMALLALFTRLPCYLLDVGEPEQTADLLESMTEAL